MFKTHAINDKYDTKAYNGAEFKCYWNFGNSGKHNSKQKGLSFTSWLFGLVLLLLGSNYAADILFSIY